MSTSVAVTELTRETPAKINWNLRVCSRRPDGYHEIESLVSPVTLYDDLTFRLRTEAGVTLDCDTPGMPLDDRNLIVKAGARLAESAGVRRGAVCRLTKRIPMGGGLGGGSSNAAAALTALNQLWQLGHALAELSRLAAKIGSDVPFFLLGGSGILRGRGECVEPVDVDFRGWIVLMLPGFPLSTAAVYGACRPRTTDDWPVQPPVALEARGWMERAFNDLEPAAQSVCPALGPLMSQAAQFAGRPVRMSGSGSTLFTAFDSSDEAGAFACDAGRRLSLETRVVRLSAEGRSASQGRMRAR